MGINAMENEAYQPQHEIGGLEKFWNFVKVTLGAIVVIFLLAWVGKAIYDRFTMPAPVSAIIEKATSSSTDDGFRNYCVNGQCVKVKMCTEVNAECGSIEPGQHFEQSIQLPASSNKLHAPKAGWGNATDEELLNMDIDSAWKEVDAQMQQGKLKPLGDGSYK